MPDTGERRVVASHRIAPQTGVAFDLARGQLLRVTDPLGGQVSDLIAFAAEDLGEWLSTGRTIDYNGTIMLGEGQTLYSNRSTPMLSVERDTVGRHDMLLAPCSQEMFERLHGVTEPHPSCFGNLAATLEPFGIEPDAIPTTVNLFMDVRPGDDGRIAIHPPASRSGDYIELRALVDLVVGVTACSAEQTNAGRFGPIDVTLFGA